MLGVNMGGGGGEWVKESIILENGKKQVTF